MAGTRHANGKRLALRWSRARKAKSFTVSDTSCWELFFSYRDQRPQLRAAYEAFRAERLAQRFVIAAVLGTVCALSWMAYSMSEGTMSYVLSPSADDTAPKRRLEESGWADLTRVFVFIGALIFNAVQPCVNSHWSSYTSHFCLATCLVLVVCVLLDSDVYLSFNHSSVAIEEIQLLASGGGASYWEERWRCAAPYAIDGFPATSACDSSNASKLV